VVNRDNWTEYAARTVPAEHAANQGSAPNFLTKQKVPTRSKEIAAAERR
jgi:hypothetical protein